MTGWKILRHQSYSASNSLNLEGDDTMAFLASGLLGPENGTVVSVPLKMSYST